MEKLKVISQERGLKVLKPGVTLAHYKAKYPTTIMAKVPSIKTLEKWTSDSSCKCPDGCKVEPDGKCPHGWDSWLIILGYI